MTAWQHVVAANAKIASVAAGARLTVHACQAAMGRLIKAGDEMGAGLHRAVAARTGVLADIDEACVADAALAFGVTGLCFMMDPESLGVHDHGRDGIGRPRAEVRSHDRMASVAIFYQVVSADKRGVVMAASALPHRGQTGCRFHLLPLQDRLVAGCAVDGRAVSPLEVAAVVERTDIAIDVLRGLDTADAHLRVQACMRLRFPGGACPRMRVRAGGLPDVTIAALERMAAQTWLDNSLLANQRLSRI